VTRSLRKSSLTLSEEGYVFSDQDSPSNGE